MKNLSENIIEIKLPQKISTNNVEQFEKEIFGVSIPEDTFEIIFDGSELVYISSVGLRSLLKFRKKYSMPVRITEVNSDIYALFETTGFTELLNIEKTLRYVDIKGLKELGRGMYGTVYRIDGETILKVFHGVNSRTVLEKILANVRVAFVKGIPTIIPFDTVKTDAGYGMVFELLNSESMADMIHENPATVEDYAKKMAELAKIMSETEFEIGEINSRNKMLREELKSAEFLFTDEENHELMSYLEAVPEKNAAVHGDFHARNIYMSNGEALLIDMDDFCMGHPVWDLACLCRVYPYLIGLGEADVKGLFDLDDSINYEDFYYKVMHVNFDEGTKLWYFFLKYYFEGYTEDEVNSFLETAKFYSDFMIIRYAIDQCRKVKDNPEKLSMRLCFIRKMLSEMRRKNVDDLIKNLENWK